MNTSSTPAQRLPTRLHLVRDASVILVFVGAAILLGVSDLQAPRGRVDGAVSGGAPPTSVLAIAGSGDAPSPTHPSVRSTSTRPSLRPAAVPTPRATATPRRTAPPWPVDTTARLSVLRACAGRSGCYLYTVRRGDNLFSIAHWFGVPLESIYAHNPWLTGAGSIYAGAILELPTPTR